MNITPETKSFSSLLPVQTGENYHIPIYQRNYTWQDSQISQLFEDLNREAPRYYIGNLIATGSTNLDSSDDMTLDIVDGQQRLVTLSLFLICCFLKSKSYSGEEDGDGPAQMRGDIVRQIFRPNENLPRMNLLDSDKEIYEGLCSLLKNMD
jgi:uncharacterized protein with ParB-like and HNH nuclease domain